MMANSSSEGNINVGGDIKGVSAYNISEATITQYFISENESEDSIHNRPLKRGYPYMGLNKFEAGDKDKFFGREQWIIKLSNHLEANNLLFLLGASGSGKSSLVKAGIIP